MITGAIFDLDGTLLDSMSVWENIGGNYLRSLGYEPKADLNERLKTMSLYQSACLFKSEYGVTASISKIMNGVNKAIEKYYFNDAELKHGVKEFLKELYYRNVKMCIASATDRYQVSAALKRCGVLNYFSEIFTCSDVGSGKDSPEIYRKALKYINTPKSKTLIFEDALYALKTANADGFITVGVYDKYEHRQDEMRKISNFYLNDFKQINDFWQYAENL